MKENHADLHLNESGLMIDPLHPHLGASRDAIMAKGVWKSRKGFPMGKESRCNLNFLVHKHCIIMFLVCTYYKITLLIVGQLTHNQKRNKIT